jgi:glycosyltransferase involved in cell wall biosynthesis
MHVLLIHQAFVSPHEAGGTRHFELGRRLIAAGGEFTIVASGVNYLTGKRVKPNVDHNTDEVRVLRAATFCTLHKSYLWRLVSFLSFMCSSVWTAWRVKQVDLVMGTSPPLFQAVSAWLVARLRRKPLLLEIRDLWPEFAIECGVLRNRLLIWLARRLERFLYARADHILVNSPAYRDYLLGLRIPEAKISFIANGVDLSLFGEPSGDKSIRREFALDGKFIVTYAGALGMANDIDTILRAAAHLRDDASIHFLLVGDGKERTRLEQMCRQLALENVTFAGPRPKFEMPDVLAASDACVATLRDIPMFRTTYPNKVFDYMAAARPTVLAIDGVIREVLEAAGGGVPVPPGDAAALARAVRELSRQRDRARRMGDAAHSYVGVHFDRNRQAAQLEQLCSRLTRKEAA